MPELVGKVTLLTPLSSSNPLQDRAELWGIPEQPSQAPSFFLGTADIAHLEIASLLPLLVGQPAPDVHDAVAPNLAPLAKRRISDTMHRPFGQRP